jgi:hypothetical protein
MSDEAEDQVRRFYLRRHDYYSGTLVVEHENEWDQHVTLRFQAYSSGGCEMILDLQELDLLREAISHLIDNHPLHKPPYDPFENTLDVEWRRSEGIGIWTAFKEGAPL